MAEEDLPEFLNPDQPYEFLAELSRKAARRIHSAGDWQRERQMLNRYAEDCSLDRTRVAGIIDTALPPAKPNGPNRAPQPVRPLRTQQMAETVEIQFDPLDWLLPGYIAEGSTLLCGRPKVGKGMFTMALSHAIVTGGEFLGRPCRQREVLYIGLEDHERRMNARGRQFATWPPGMHWCDAEELTERGPKAIERIEATLRENTRIGAVFVDPLVAIADRRDKNEEEYEHAFRNVRAYTLMAKRTKTACVIVHHLNKSVGADVLDQVHGSTGYTGAADCIAALQRTNQEGGRRLTGRPRDFNEFDKQLDADLEHNQWTEIGDYEPQPEFSATRQQILDHLKNSPCSLSPKQIAEALSLPETNVRHLLRRLNRDHKVHREIYGSYSCPK